jgi:hypothetical protein
MKYAIEERFTDDLGFTFEKAVSVREGVEDFGKKLDILYIMKSHENCFRFLDKDRYDIAYRQHKAAFLSRLS